jgi:anti-sigma factor RsiW
MCLDNIVINSFIDNVLDENETKLVTEHLAVCQKCNSFYNSLKTLVVTVQSLPRPEVPAGFLDNLLLRIEGETHPSFEELSYYYDHNTGDSEIGEHLASCTVCSEQFNNIKVISRSAAGLENYQPSADFFAALTERIDSLETGLNEEAEPYRATPDFFDGLMSRIEGLSGEVNCISSEDLSAFLDNEQTDIPFSQIESHLESCSKCMSKYASFKASRNSALNLKQPDVPFTFSRKVIEEINRNEGKVPAGKILRFLPYIRKSGPKVSMVAGIIIAGILVTMSRSVMEQPEQAQTATNITVRSEDILFSPNTSTYRTDSFEILADNSKDDSLEIEDIGL